MSRDRDWVSGQLARKIARDRAEAWHDAAVPVTDRRALHAKWAARDAALELAAAESAAQSSIDAQGVQGDARETRGAPHSGTAGHAGHSGQRADGSAGAAGAHDDDGAWGQ